MIGLPIIGCVIGTITMAILDHRGWINDLHGLSLKNYILSYAHVIEIDFLFDQGHNFKIKIFNLRKLLA